MTSAKPRMWSAAWQATHLMQPGGLAWDIGQFEHLRTVRCFPRSQDLFYAAGRYQGLQGALPCTSRQTSHAGQDSLTPSVLEKGYMLMQPWFQGFFAEGCPPRCM